MTEFEECLLVKLGETMVRNKELEDSLNLACKKLQTYSYNWDDENTRKNSSQWKYCLLNNFNELN